MPRFLALLLCLAWVVLLLRVERKYARTVSGAIWIPTVWMLSIASKPLAYWFGVYSQAGEGSPLDRGFLIVLLLIGIRILVKRRFDWSGALRNNGWLVLLLGYMLVSMGWSNFPLSSLKRWIRELVAVVMACVVLSDRDARAAAESILRRCAYILIPFSLLLIRYFPEHGVEFGRWSGVRMWIGVTTQKNGLGRLCIIAALFLIWSLVRARQLRGADSKRSRNYSDALVLILALYLLTGGGFTSTYSATALGALAGGLAVLLTLVSLKRFRTLGLTRILWLPMMLLVAFGIVSVFRGGSTMQAFTSTVGREDTLTGRADVWSALLPVALQTPLLGHGVGGFWNERSREFYMITEGHSGYLDLLLELGFAGILIVSMFLLSSCSRASRALATDFHWGTLWMCYLFMAGIHNLTETSINSLTSHLTGTLLFLAVASVGMSEKTRERPLRLRSVDWSGPGPAPTDAVP